MLPLYMFTNKKGGGGGWVEAKNFRRVVYFAATSGSFGEIQCDTSRYSPSKPSGYFNYHYVSHSQILRSAHTLYLCVLCGSQNKQPLFPYTTLTDRFV